MSYREQGWAKGQSQLLMDIAGTLADFTQKLDLCREIPAYLGRMLNIEPLTLGVVRETEDKPAVVVFHASSGAIGAAENNGAFAQDLLAIYQQTRPLSAQDRPTLRPVFDLDEIRPDDVSEMSVQRLAAFPRATVFARTIDDQHRLLLVVHQRAEQANLSAEQSEVFQLISSQLAKLLECLMIWTARPQQLGAPFSRLTDRELMVLRGLDSDVGEKQLADQLGLSPHTLHSHIKSIYRKVGVQGRLPLLLRVEETMRGLRRTRLSKRTAPGAAINEERAVAVG